MDKTINTRIVIIEDDSTIRESYAYLLSQAEGLIVVNSYNSYEEAEQHIDADLPDVILLDIELPGISGIDAITRIRKKIPGTHILMLTVYENEEKIFNALRNGAAGYLTKNTDPARIISAINEVMEGGGPMSAGIAKLVISSFQKNSNSPLTKRETQILERIAEGKSRTKIATDFFINVETVKTHIKNIYYKLNVNSREEALKIARKEKFI